MPTPLSWCCQCAGVRRTIEVNEKRDDLQEIIDKALEEMAAEAGEGFSIDTLSLAEFCRRTGLTRSRARTTRGYVCVLSSCFEQMGLRREPWTKTRGSSARPAPSLAFPPRPFHHGAETARRCGHVVTSDHVPRLAGYGVGGGRAGTSRPGRGSSPSVGLICSVSP